ncbi:MAG: response regulator [Magnetococcales bacterium]|nr:response regulator [Magnetococcales bacterium]
MVKLLTIDDSKTIRRVISGIGAALGYEVLEAEHGAAGLEVLEQRADEVGLILLDWNMPGMNGLEVLKKIKADQRWKHIPVMMVTTEGEREYIIQAIQAGAIHYQTKPFTQEDISARIMEALGQGKGRVYGDGS